MTRVDLNKDLYEVVFDLSEGNPGAITVLAMCLKEAKQIDTQHFDAGLGVLLALDASEIYGKDIWVLFKDHCHENLSKFIAVLRGCQLGLISPAMLKSGAFSVNDTCISVVSQLGKTNFRLDPNP